MHREAERMRLFTRRALLVGAGQHRGRAQQSIPILYLPLPNPRPACAEWIEAYRQWIAGE